MPPADPDYNGGVPAAGPFGGNDQFSNPNWGQPGAFLTGGGGGGGAYPGPSVHGGFGGPGVLLIRYAIPPNSVL